MSDTDFLHPYGGHTSEEEVTDAMMSKKLHDNNCEWLVRPAVAASELVDTISKNFERSTNSLHELCNLQIRKRFDDMLQSVTDKLLPLWSRSDNPRINDVLSLHDLQKSFESLKLELLYDDSSDKVSTNTLQGEFFQAYLDEMIESGSSMFLIGMHLRCFTYVLQNVQEISKHARNSQELKEFKNTPTLESYVETIFNEYIQNKSAVIPIAKTKRSLISFLENNVHDDTGLNASSSSSMCDKTTPDIERIETNLSSPKKKKRRTNFVGNLPDLS